MVVGAAVISREVTAYKRSLEALRKSERYLESVLEHIPSMVYLKEAETLRFSRINRAGEEMLGLPREQLIGRSATLSEPIVNGRGQIRIDDTVWRCEGEDLAAGARVRVVGLRGAIVEVEKLG